MKKAQLFFPFAAFLLIIVGFQNCSGPAPGADSLNSSSTTSRVQFAYKTDIDQLAYMSCHQLGGSFDNSSYFTFRAGAYGASAGAGFSSQFLNDQASVPKSNWKFLLSNSPVNTGARPLLSVRIPNQAQSYLASKQGTGPNYDASPMLMDLSSDTIANNLISNPSSKIRYQRNGSPLGTRVEGDLNFNFGIDGLNELQYQMQNLGAVVAINYPVSSSSAGQIRAPAQYFKNLNINDALQFVYGRGYKVTFRQHPAATYGGSSSSKVHWALGSVQEVDMESGANNSTIRNVTNNLSCNDNLIFRIVRPRDVVASPTGTNQINCDMKADNPAALSSTDRELLRRARLSLRVEDWYIDWAKKCIVPKKSSLTTNDCYGAPGNGVQIEYDLSKDCVDSPSVTSVRACAALASICIR